MAVKLIASDLDGTLMATDHMTVAERTKNALVAAHNKGIKIAIATGRTLTFTNSVTAQIPFVDYVVSSNGAAVYDRNAGEYVYSTLVPNADALEAVYLADRGRTPRKNEISYRVRRFALAHSMDERTVWRRLDEAKKLYLDFVNRL